MVNLEVFNGWFTIFLYMHCWCGGMLTTLLSLEIPCTLLFCWLHVSYAVSSSPIHSSFSPILLLPYSLLLSPPLGGITSMPAEQRTNLSCLISYPPTWPATISGKVPIHRYACIHICTCVTGKCWVFYTLLCYLYMPLLQLYVHLTTLPPSYPPINCTLPNSLSPSQPPSLSPTHPSLSSLA